MDAGHYGLAWVGDSMQSITTFNQNKVLEHIFPSSTAVDCTTGNGHDTLFLSKHANLVHGFDVQKEALAHAKALLDTQGLKNVTLHHLSHTQLDKIPMTNVDIIMFNFGWLPGSSDKTLTTKKKTSLEALEKACHLITPGGLVTLALYPGHEEGALEARAIEAYASTLDKHTYQAVSYKPLNTRNSPYSIIIEKRKD